MYYFVANLQHAACEFSPTVPSPLVWFRSVSQSINSQWPHPSKMNSTCTDSNNGVITVLLSLAGVSGLTLAFTLATDRVGQGFHARRELVPQTLTVSTGSVSTEWCLLAVLFQVIWRLRFVQVEVAAQNTKTRRHQRSNAGSWRVRCDLSQVTWRL